MEYRIIANYQLPKDANQQLIQIMREDARSHVRNRAHAIILLFGDHRTFEDVADIFKVHVNTVRNWAERWISMGIDGIYDLDGRGADPIFSADEEQVIIKLLEKEPRSLKQLAAKVEEELGIKASIATFRRIIKKHGKSWKRQRKILKGKPTEEEYEKGKAEIEEIKMLAKDGEFNIVYFDASGFTLQPSVPYAWQDIGQAGVIGIPSSHSKRINVLGIMDPIHQDLNISSHIGSMTSTLVIDAIDRYCDDLTEETVILLDNAPIHTCNAVTERIDEWDRRGLTLYFIPRYSPALVQFHYSNNSLIFNQITTTGDNRVFNICSHDMPSLRIPSATAGTHRVVKCVRIKL
jgi:transposase